jgi:hypothetical protein
MMMKMVAGFSLGSPQANAALELRSQRSYIYLLPVRPMAIPVPPPFGDVLRPTAREETPALHSGLHTFAQSYMQTHTHSTDAQHIHRHARARTQSPYPPPRSWRPS